MADVQRARDLVRVTLMHMAVVAQALGVNLFIATTTILYFPSELQVQTRLVVLSPCSLTEWSRVAETCLFIAHIELPFRYLAFLRAFSADRVKAVGCYCTLYLQSSDSQFQLLEAEKG